MGVTTVNVTQEEPVHFRVAGVQPNPVTPHPPSDAIVLSIEYVNKPGGGHFGMSPNRYAPHRDALAEAINSQAVYWVDWDDSKTPNWPPRMDDSLLDRLLRAIADRQLVTPAIDIDEP